MSASTWFWRLLCTVSAGLFLTPPGGADDKDGTDAGKGKDAKNVIVIQLDASKVPPDLLRKMLELSKNTADDDKKGEKGRPADDKKGEKGRPADDKKGEKGRPADDDKKGEKGRPADDDKKGEKGKPNIVQVDLNKLPPELAKRLREELAKSKGGGK